MSDKGFDLRWREFPRPQATVRSTWAEKTGMAPEELRGMTVLDAGCGCGRNLVMLQQAGVEDLWGCDISPTGVEAAQGNTRRYTEVWRQDLLQPLEMGNYNDFVFSHGVLHHTADPRLAFKNVAAAVKPGGQLSVWVYAQPVSDDLDPHMQFLHEITKACPPEALMAACRRWAVKMRDLNGSTWDALRAVLRVSGSADEDECISDTFDWHCPQFRSWHDAEEVMSWFEGAGFDVVFVGGFPTSVRGVKLPRGTVLA